ncbi:lipase family protein [Nocardia sp. NPDC004068]|uniref:lipase family protein n=1 Tax=Nocardia sp. NPDC004068 TaxID=3364303 RepID=UPI003678CD5C
MITVITGPAAAQADTEGSRPDTSADGAIVSAHPIVLFGLPVPVKAWQVSFTSHDGQNLPTTGKTTILEPDTPWTGPGARPVISWQVAEDSLGSQCSPSYAFEHGVDNIVNESTLEATLATTVLQRNWALAFPDYQGPRERFLEKTQAAHAILDGIRAAKAFAPAGLADSPIALLGYSGGAMANMWATQALPHYAPELRLAGVATGGLPVDLVHQLERVSGTVYAGIGLLAIAAVHRLAPEADVPGLLNDRGKRMLAETTNFCLADFTLKYPFVDIGDYTAVPDIVHNPRFQAILRSLSVEPDASQPPTYFWESTTDDLLPIDDADRLVASWCRAGGQVTYARLPIPGHGLPDMVNLPAALDYLGDRFAGAPTPECG